MAQLPGKDEEPHQPLPPIALAMGDPAGIGPEIIVKALKDPRVYRACVPIVVGDAGVLARAPGWGPEGPHLELIDDVPAARPRPGVLSVLNVGMLSPSLRIGEASTEGGRASMEYLARATKLALTGHVAAVVFGPLNKAAMKKAGLTHPDEYGYFAELCGSDGYTVLMVSPRFTLASVTLHVPLQDVAKLITRERVLATIRRSDRAARAAGIARPRIGVAALNPHGGEGGTLGAEDREAILPAVEAARGEGIDANGPFPADTFFMTVVQPAYDVYVGMYHDQGRIALKLVDFGRATTTAEGLPVLYFTVGHGSAYDIAGHGVARHENMVDTLLLAARRSRGEQIPAR